MTFPDRKYTDIAAFSDDYFDRERATARWARDNDVAVIAFTGFSGGRTAELATVNVHVDADNYGVIEDTHQALMHILAQYIRQTHMDEGLIAERKF